MLIVLVVVPNYTDDQLLDDPGAEGIGNYTLAEGDLALYCYYHLRCGVLVGSGHSA